ncbi:MAG TPA: cytochrome d ubiquinol oxidase subunit II [Ktedonobacteraceae bacterium]|jgi:cytochrome d ubiquinol oxidase subunit II|nr:cytochrome d ubiquinol oxidase subunit II [Ktedonobacteraceae bacterium]
MSVALVALSLVWAGFIAYVALGGADFGAGVWDLLASGPTARRQHQFISRVLGPVWEANHVWLIFLLVGLMNLFPTAFATFMSALFIPLTIALVGIVLRGAGFIFRTHASQDKSMGNRLWSRVFSISSLLTPFFLGVSAAAVAGGQIRTSGITQTDLLTGWISPFSVAVGVMAVAQCATLAAVYLTAEAHAQGEKEFVAAYRLKALISSGLVSVLGILCVALSVTAAPWLWSGLLAHAFLYVGGTVIMGLLVLAMLLLKRYRLASLFVILETALMLISWGVSQYPYLIPPKLTIEQAANSPAMITTMLVALLIGMAIVLPSLFYLFRVFKWTPIVTPEETQAQ